MKCDSYFLSRFSELHANIKTVTKADFQYNNNHNTCNNDFIKLSNCTALEVLV